MTAQYYWLGMFKLGGGGYMWVDNGYIGGLAPRRASPYVHVRTALSAPAMLALVPAKKVPGETGCCSQLALLSTVVFHARPNCRPGTSTRTSWH